MHWTTRANLTAMAIVTIIGALDAARSGQNDLLAVFVVLLILEVPLLTGLDRRRRVVLLRRDLADWVDHRSSTTGEPAGAIADRAVARHRDSLEDGREPAASATSNA